MALIDEFKLRPRRNLHDSYEDPVQKMLVVMRAGEERAPHANARELTQVIIAGHGEMIIYDDAGNETERFPIGTRTNFCWTLPAGMFHTKKVLSEYVVFLEIMKGPYVAGDVRELHH